jgi:hypothetical protein
VSDNTPQELSAEEARRLVQWLQNELERQRNINKEMRIAVADLAPSKTVMLGKHISKK